MRPRVIHFLYGSIQGGIMRALSFRAWVSWWFFVPAASAEPCPHAYFPHSIGSTWTYQIGARTSTLTITKSEGTAATIHVTMPAHEKLTAIDREMRQVCSPEGLTHDLGAVFGG